MKSVSAICEFECDRVYVWPCGTCGGCGTKVRMCRIGWEEVHPKACSFMRDDAVPDEVTMPGPTGCRCLTRSKDRWPDVFYVGTVEGKCA